MKLIIDVVNFNADASCLFSEHWLEILCGGKDSQLCKWLNLYIEQKKKVVIGFTGATIADIVQHNSQAIDLINSNRHIFQILLRPFAHDISLFRSTQGFEANLNYGKKTLEHVFQQVCNIFLPPEFMSTRGQIKQLADFGIHHIFLHPQRFPDETRSRIPEQPFVLSGLFDSQITCIPFVACLTDDYLYSIHNYSTEKWNSAILDNSNDVLFSWRDGESSFFIPNGLQREKKWLAGEKSEIQRAFITPQLIDVKEIEKKIFPLKTYPIHSFSAWMKELRMLWFINKCKDAEKDLQNMSKEQFYIWLQMINSDIFSAIEKKSPRINLLNEDGTIENYTIWRSSRGFEGEEYYEILVNFNKPEIQNYFYSSQNAHIIKIRERAKFLRNLDSVTS